MQALLPGEARLHERHLLAHLCHGPRILGELGAGGDAQPLDGLLRVLKVLRQHARALAVDQVQLALALPLHCVHCAFRPALYGRAAHTRALGEVRGF